MLRILGHIAVFCLLFMLIGPFAIIPWAIKFIFKP